MDHLAGFRGCAHPPGCGPPRPWPARRRCFSPASPFQRSSPAPPRAGSPRRCCKPSTCASGPRRSPAFSWRRWPWGGPSARIGGRRRSGWASPWRRWRCSCGGPRPKWPSIPLSGPMASISAWSRSNWWNRVRSRSPPAPPGSRRARCLGLPSCRRSRNGSGPTIPATASSPSGSAPPCPWRSPSRPDAGSTAPPPAGGRSCCWPCRRPTAGTPASS